MPESICKRIYKTKDCERELTDGGVDDSGICCNCWYPSILDDQKRYRDLLEEGYSRYQAAVMSGLTDPHEASENRVHRLGTTPQAAVTQDDDDPEEELQDQLTSDILDRMDDDDMPEDEQM
ncbi:hypothetical protein [Paraburkholderia sp. BCC1886]|uniref:hypothetical protein n=1 Tax=Paraburkholderia sp. BCC1886 TaxID=2562670 RepID=UPI0011846081|nr:hypothetical protein [Paraburkholderia sp. BCC1886]